MSQSADIIANSPDLNRLSKDFEIRIKDAHLLIDNIPYVTAEKVVARGILIFPLTMASAVRAGTPPTHEAWFIGEYPHYIDGTPISGMVNGSKSTIALTNEIIANFHLSSKPEVADIDYDIKVRRYVETISSPALAIDKTARAETLRIVENEEEDSPFVFPDTNSSRAQITSITNRLKGLKIAIIGTGGTGSYILDLVAKTPVKEIHIFDDDIYSVHNAYRSPGSPTKEQLDAGILKVDYLKETYSRFHNGIMAHPEPINSVNVNKLDGMDFVFLSMNPGPDKKQLVNYLVDKKISFIDTGLGVEKTVSDKLIGMVSLITVTTDYNGHLEKIPVKSEADHDLYKSNIQIAELNALNAVLAVIRWKKLFMVYEDNRGEHECSYTIGPNMLINEETKT